MNIISRLRRLFRRQPKLRILEHIGSARLYLAESDPFFNPDILRPEADLIWINLHTRATFQWLGEGRTWVFAQTKTRVPTVRRPTQWSRWNEGQLVPEDVRVSITSIVPIDKRTLNQIVVKRWMKDML